MPTARLPLLAMAMLSLSAAPALAGAYEGFLYAPGTLISGQNGGSGWTVPWSADFSVLAGNTTLSYPFALPPSGVAAANTGPAHLAREFKPGVGDIDTVNRPWMSFLVEREQAEPFSLTMNGLFVDPVHLTIDPDGTVRLQYGADPPGTSGKLASGPNVTDMFIIHLQPGSPAAIQLWLDPAGPLGPPDAAVQAPSDVNYGNVDFLMGIHQLIDEIRTGPSLATVAALGCRPDLNGDGNLDIFDFLIFVNLFNAGDIAADFDFDGELQIFDFLEFENAFNLGC